MDNHLETNRNLMPSANKPEMVEFSRWHFRPTIGILLVASLIILLIIPYVIYLKVPWPSGTSDGTKIAILIAAVLLFLLFWMIIYRNTRPKRDAEYKKRRNLIGRGLILIGVALCILLLFANYFLIADVSVADLTFLEYWYYPCLSRFNLTLLETQVDFGRFLSTLRYQLIFSVMFVAVARHYSPTLQTSIFKNVEQKVKRNLILAGIWILFASLLCLFGLGYVWEGTQGRIYLLFGLYDEEFSIKLIPTLVFFIANPILYLRARQYFWSDSISSKPEQSRVTQTFILICLFIFTFFLSINTIDTGYLIRDVGIPFAVFLLINMILGYGIILNIQANNSIMSGKPAKNVISLSRLFWVIFWCLLLGYIAAFLLLEVGINIELGEIFAYFPNLIFGMIFTAGLYYLSLNLDQKLMNKTRKESEVE
jgi:hypothetical protein